MRIENRAFIDKVINFFMLGLALYVVAQIYQWTSDDKVIKRTVKCKYCRKRISEKVFLMPTVRFDLMRRNVEGLTNEYE